MPVLVWRTRISSFHLDENLKLVVEMTDQRYGAHEGYPGYTLAEILHRNRHEPISGYVVADLIAKIEELERDCAAKVAELEKIQDAVLDDAREKLATLERLG